MRLIGLLVVLALALLTPLVAEAQQTGKVARIGIVSVGGTSSDMIGPQPRRPSTKAFLRGLHELGYVYGEHFVTEPRAVDERLEGYPALAAQLVRLHVDVIVAAGPAVPALQQATATIPIVMAAAADPVRDGFARSLGHPGGNVTGLSLGGAELGTKRLDLLNELVPSAKLVAVIWEPSVSPREIDAAARARGRKLLSLEVRRSDEIDRAFKTAIDARAGALLVVSGGLLTSEARRIAELAAKSRLPAMYPLRFFVEGGGLISYGTDIVDVWRRAAAFVDKILKGAKPTDLPVEQPTKFELVINLKAAKALKLTIPQTLLLQADQLIE
jgi:putative tryptophan/tyrosine transport system substrate-binding protein